LGRLGEAEKELVPARELSESLGFRIITARLDLMIAELAFRRGEVNDAVRSLDQVYNWASQAYDQEMVVAADVLSASIALSVRDLDGASRRLRDGLRVAEEGGYGIYWIDLKVLEGHMHLVANDFQRAYELGKHGLEGHRNRGERPNLLGASSKGCAYRWGEADALQLIGQAQAGMGDRAKALKTLDAVIAIRRSLSDPRTDEAERLREEVGGVS
jgi:tetratricopeptide (TPR) repeat protein